LIFGRARTQPFDVAQDTIRLEAEMNPRMACHERACVLSGESKNPMPFDVAQGTIRLDEWVTPKWPAMSERAFCPRVEWWSRGESNP
jgi:hypothetical protein